VDHIKQGEIALIINTPLGRASHYDEQAIRRAALQHNVPCVTTMTGAQALVDAIIAQTETQTRPVTLQELHDGSKSEAQSSKLQVQSSKSDSALAFKP